MREEVNEIADAKISVHDRHRFEIKLDVELGEGPSSGYRVDTYFFVPRALNINPSTYSKDHFYRSIQRYVRFKTPHFALPAITDPATEASPFNRIRWHMIAMLQGPDAVEARDAIFSEIKMLGAVTRAAIRDAVKALLDQFGRVPRSPDAAARLCPVQEHVAAFIRDVEAYVSAVRELGQEMLQPLVPVRLREAFRFFDEFTSLTIQDYLSTLLHAMRERDDLIEPFASLDADVAAIILAQQSHRQQMGYPSVLSNGKTDSTLLYRRGVLKKFILNVLYLSPEQSEWETSSQIPLAVAAGFAMLFAASVMLFVQNRYASNSAPFITVVVISYIFKDRLKDWLKLFLSKGMVKWTADRKIRIRDPYSGRVIGSLKEAFSFGEEARIPDSVRYCRHMDSITSIDEEGKPEWVVKYEKEVSLFPARISRFHQRRRDLNDIMRFNIDDFIRQADDPLVDYLHLDPASGELKQVQCQRVYHVNIVLAYRSLETKRRAVERLERIRLILNRDGIVKLEEVAAVPQA